MKKTIIIILAVVILAGVGIYFWTRSSPADDKDKTPATSQDDKKIIETPVVEPEKSGESVIGKSVDGRDITAYRYGTGTTEILFIGGIHGGYEWNTALVAYELMEYLKANPSVVPNKVKVTVIPVLNPDGLSKVVATTTEKFAKTDVSSSQSVQISGRYNANKVDLNRNFDCDWKPTGKWQSTTVSGGSAMFSEPESQAIKKYIEGSNPAAVLIWYSAAGGVYSSNCHDGILQATRTLTDLYAKASGYPAHESFDFYETTGDMANWLAKQKIPAISVLLTTHEDTEWAKNQKGVEAVLQYFGK